MCRKPWSTNSRASSIAKGNWCPARASKSLLPPNCAPTRPIRILCRLTTSSTASSKPTSKRCAPPRRSPRTSAFRSTWFATSPGKWTTANTSASRPRPESKLLRAPSASAAPFPSPKNSSPDDPARIVILSSGESHQQDELSPVNKVEPERGIPPESLSSRGRLSARVPHPACPESRRAVSRVRFLSCGTLGNFSSAAFQAASVAQAPLPVLFLVVVIPSEPASADEPRDLFLLLVAPPSRRPPWHRHSCLCFS